jgi:hypothetical protein
MRIPPGSSSSERRSTNGSSHPESDRLLRATQKRREEIARDLEALKANFLHLRNEVGAIITDVFAVEKPPADRPDEPTTRLTVPRSPRAAAVQQHRESLLQSTKTDAVSRLVQKARENPATSALVAFGLGFLASKLIRRRS